MIERFMADPAAGVARVADALRAYWETCFAEFWPRVYGLLERDVLRRSRQLAQGGARELFAGARSGGGVDGGAAPHRPAVVRARAGCTATGWCWCRARSTGRRWP